MRTAILLILILAVAAPAAVIDPVMPKITSDWRDVLRLSEPYYDVKAYGAVGDGVTDDATAIQAAIDAVEAAGGGIVYFPQGTYIIDAVLTIDSDNVTLRGVGNTAILKCKDSTSINLILINASNITVEKLAFDGNQSGNVYQGSSAIQNGIYVKHTEALSDLRFRDLEIHDTLFDGLRCSGETNVNRIWVENCYIHDISRQGMSLISGSNAKITNCVIDDTGRNGISIATTGGDLLVSGCTINDVDNGQVGIYVIGDPADDVHDIRIVNNTLTDDGDGNHGINVSAYAQHIVVSSNIATGWLYDGIVVDTAEPEGVDDNAYAAVTGN
ncbi:MAG TPA: hypothetical protein ENI81_09070, partial [Phycisphaerales bacterium]|nr:hypothetical protein [Phycisphaerales bacterium]